MGASPLVRQLDPEQKQAYAKAELFSGGAAGVDQGKHNDCWFDASLAAIARTRKGQVTIARMIAKNGSESFTVTFPGDPSQPVDVTLQELGSKNGLRNDALWSGILEAAAMKKFPQQASQGGHAILALRLLTGGQSQSILLSQYRPEQIANIIENCLGAEQPITAGSKPENLAPNSPVQTAHMHTVLAFDPQTQTVILRNPWGYNSMNRNAPRIEQNRNGVLNLGAGVLQMSIPTLQKYFGRLAFSSWGPEDMKDR